MTGGSETTAAVAGGVSVPMRAAAVSLSRRRA